MPLRDVLSSAGTMCSVGMSSAEMAGKKMCRTRAACGSLVSIVVVVVSVLPRSDGN